MLFWMCVLSHISHSLSFSFLSHANKRFRSFLTIKRVESRAQEPSDVEIFSAPLKLCYPGRKRGKGRGRGWVCGGGRGAREVDFGSGIDYNTKPNAFSQTPSRTAVVISLRFWLRS